MGRHGNRSVEDEMLEPLRALLRSLGREEKRISAEGFFKEPVRFHGLTNAEAERLGKEFFRENLRGKPKNRIFDLCTSLMASGMMEETLIACHWSQRLQKQYEPSDFVYFEAWISTYVNNWATCDTLCNHTVGDFIQMYPDFLARLKEFTQSENRWMRRAAAVSLIIPARKGKFLSDIFGIADLLLTDRDDLVQKGYGWMLKVAGEAHPEEVFRFVLDRRDTMPRTALRYAIEKLNPEQKKEAMEQGERRKTKGER